MFQLQRFTFVKICFILSCFFVSNLSLAAIACRPGMGGGCPNVPSPGPTLPGGK